MTNELEKQFFDTFGIEPKWKSEQCDGWLRTTAEAYFTNLEEAKKFGIVFQEEPEYPQISDRILLELICIVNKYLDEGFWAENMTELKEEVLKNCLLAVNTTDYGVAGYEESFKHQVQALFGGND